MMSRLSLILFSIAISATAEGAWQLSSTKDEFGRHTGYFIMSHSYSGESRDSIQGTLKLRTLVAITAEGFVVIRAYQQYGSGIETQVSMWGNNVRIQVGKLQGKIHDFGSTKNMCSGSGVCLTQEATAKFVGIMLRTRGSIRVSVKSQSRFFRGSFWFDLNANGFNRVYRKLAKKKR